MKTSKNQRFLAPQDLRNLKVLVVGDFQGVFPEKLKKKLKKEEFDIVVAVGDYGGIDEWQPYIFDIFKRIKKGEERI